MDKKDLKVVSLRPAVLSPKDIPVSESLVRLADAIADGVHGAEENVQVAIVVYGDKLHAFGFNCDGTEAHYLLCCGARKVEGPMLEHGR